MKAFRSTASLAAAISVSFYPPESINFFFLSSLLTNTITRLLLLLTALHMPVIVKMKFSRSSTSSRRLQPLQQL